MKHIKVPLLYLFGLYATMLGVYVWCRLWFIIFNQSAFQFTEIPSIFLSGLRFDISAILATNLLFFVLWVAIKPFDRPYFWRKSLRLIFLAVNGWCLFLSFADMAYFPFLRKRIQADVFLFPSGQKGSDIFGIIPYFILHFWYIWILLIATLWIVNVAYKKLDLWNYSNIKIEKYYVTHVAMALILTVLHVIGIRGGLQLRPLTLLNAVEVAGVQNAPFILNTPFSIIQTWDKKTIHALTLPSNVTLEACDLAQHHHLNTSTKVPKKWNVVILIVESLSRQYMSYYGGPAKMPFLDSLMSLSMVFDRAYANGRESVHGVPAVLASMPAWMDEAFIFSKYGTNKFQSLPSVLKNEGYYASFFHGANVGTMGFYPYCQSAGFDKYYSIDDFPNAKKSDHSPWGIWDENYLSFMADEITRHKQPFLSAVLTINAHHPFELPKHMESRCKIAGHPILSCVQYTDYALEQFFEKAKKQSWYEHTLFVITADHTGPNTLTDRPTLTDDYKIPIIFFRPDHALKGHNDRIANQIDIMPTVLDFLQLRQNYFSFGKSLLQEDCPDININYKAGIYQIIDNSACLYFDGRRTIAFFPNEADQISGRNRAHDSNYQCRRQEMEDILLKRIHVYQHRMIENKMVYGSQ